MAINLSNVRYSYPDQGMAPVLDIRGWTLSVGERAFIHGPSGSGKSTFLALLSGLLPSSEGQITIFGKRLDRMSGHQRDLFRANNIGHVFQLFNLIPYLDAIDNVRLARYFSRSQSNRKILLEIRDLLAALNISERDWKKPTQELSVGQQQRVAIARSLINKPNLLIADEPTSSLDRENRDLFMSLLMPIVQNNGISLVFVSHELSLSSHFDRIEALSDISKTEGRVGCSSN